MTRLRDAAANLAHARGSAALAFKHDPGLPLTAKREEIIALLRAHPVLIVAGDTGSGKSTQLPQYCLEIGRGIEGLIAHTQPRRLAARALAGRIAEELAQPVGRSVGYRVRFADRVSDGTRLVLMTDGMLLAELNADPMLRRYDTVIVDEAHERTMNVDLLLGVLKRLVARRADLKVIVTSATLDVERMAKFFDDAPVVTASGRGHPIEVRYSDPSADGDDPDLPAAVLQACRAIESEPGPVGRGDVLVFLPGEREITDVGELLERELSAEVEVIPLYARLSWEQQSRIFQRGARRRIVLATNVAETSITVPGIRAVIDSGLARVSRYSARSRLQRLPIERVSQASADQRKGRCGRLGSGLCIRLFSEEDFLARDAFTEPEILRTNLAALLLRMAADGLGGAERFPFIDPPESRALTDGYRLLQELAALDERNRITRIGRQMARLPLDPRLARALLESKRFHAESELLAIVSGLSVPDPRLRGRGDREEPAEGVRVPAGKSEFLEFVNIWRAYRKAREGPRRELRRWCKERGLSLLRLCEWDDVHAQVEDRAAEVGIVAARRGASYTGVHRALLAGFCTMVGVRGEEGVYSGTRGVRFQIFPGSSLRRRKPRWVMAANIVETARVYARCVAEIDPVWIESAAEHLVKREYLEPDWDEVREEVLARERTSLFGLALAGGRLVNYGPIAPEESRRIFAREALVHERLTRRPEWLASNDAAIRAAKRVEDRLRTRDIVAGPESFVDFYDKALPRQVSSAATLESFSRRLGAPELSGLRLGEAEIYLRRPDAGALAEYPERVEIGGLGLDVVYRFAPGEADDGATLSAPLLALPELTRAAVDGAIPGYARPRVEALLRSLPKDARRRLIPIGETAARFIVEAGPAAANQAVLAAWLRDSAAVPAALVRFDPRALPSHLTPQIAVVEAGREIARGVDLPRLRAAMAPRARAALDRAAAADYPAPWRRFELDALPESHALAVAAGAVRVHPALERIAGRIEIRFYWTAVEADRHHRGGATGLARILLARQARDLRKRFAEDSQLLLAASPYQRGDALTDALLQIAFRRACFADRVPPRERAAFERAVDQARENLYECAEALRAEAMGWFTAARDVRRNLEDPRARTLGAYAEETRAHLAALLREGDLAAASDAWLARLPRYLRAQEKRWQRLGARGAESPQIAREIDAWTQRREFLVKGVAEELRWLPALDEFAWWVEEFRVSLYAQELRTAVPISAARLAERAAEIEAWLRR